VADRLIKLVSVGVDGVAGGHGEIRRELLQGEPADLAGLARFAILGAAVGYAAQIGRGNPVLAFLGQEVVGDAEKGFDEDGEADFFERFTEGAAVKGLEVFELAADDAPGAGFRGKLTKGEERAAAVVEERTPTPTLGIVMDWAELFCEGIHCGGKGRSLLHPYEFI
jgi:hypothetical protein